MVSYYNSLSYPQKHSAANLPYPGSQPWQWTANYHTPPNHQYLSDMDSPHAAHHQMYYNPHAMFHSASNAVAASDWHSPSTAENFTQNAHMLQQQHHQLINGSALANGSTPSTNSGNSTSTTSGGSASATSQLNETASSIGDQQQQHPQQPQQQQQPPHITEGLPSPPITVSGSEISSPGAPASSSSPHHIAHHLSNNNNSPTANNSNNNNTNNKNRTSPIRSHQFYDWMNKPSYPTQPAPGKTRTKDKYRVVYTDFQRLELEKEYCTSRYITIRRKTEMAQALSLSERQVKIWFQNRRAKERKQNKKGNEPTIGGVPHPDYANLMDTKPKLEPGLHLQHSLHSINTMAMAGMPAMRLHPHLHGHPLAVSAAHSHQLHQSSHAQISAAAVASVNSLPM